MIRWHVDEERIPRKFRLSWEERGGPRVAPPTREGFGRKYLTQIASDLPGAVGGLSFPPEGLNWLFERDAQIVCAPECFGHGSSLPLKRSSCRTQTARPSPTPSSARTRTRRNALHMG